MRFLHISDLHLGKVLNEFSMIEDQRDVLLQIISMAEEKKVDGILMAGDIYDRSIPSVEAVQLFDWFLCELEERTLEVYIISGNHDSKERLCFGNKIFDKKQIYMQGNVGKQIPYIQKEDDYGIVRIYLLPFFRIAEGKKLFGLEHGSTYEDILKCMLEETKIDVSVRNILVSHLFFSSAKEAVQTCDSELALSVGGVSFVPVELVKDFDYVALGHLHGPQKVSSERIRYAGSPLKYSFSEEFHKKSAVLLELKEKGDITIEALPLKPLHDMRRIKGECKVLMSEEVAGLCDRNDYVSITLTDQEEILEPAALLRTVYPNLMQIRFLKNEEKYGEKITTIRGKERSPMELFDSFLEEVRGEKEAQRSTYMSALIEEIKEG